MSDRTRPPSRPPGRPAPDAEGRGGGEPKLPPGGQRALTNGEIALLRKYFRDAIRYDAVRVFRRRYAPMQPRSVAMAPNGHVYFPGAGYCDDFAEATLAMRTWFVHEMVHVWQHQNRVTQDLRWIGLLAILSGDYRRPCPVTGAAGRRLYSYRHLLDGPPRDLGDFGYEQQASIIEDYYHAIQLADAGRTIGLDRFDAPGRGLLSRFLEDPAYLRGRRSRRRLL